MPATYAHYRFGKSCIETLSDSLKDIINKHRELFDIGVHGPDILFYYEAYHKCPVSDVGFDMHKINASEFFTNARLAYANSPLDKDALMSYLLGFLSHFVLDYNSHSYVEAKEFYSKVSHTEIETQNDRHLLIMDGLNPLKYDTVCHIVPSKENAIIIHEFFKNLSLDDIHKSLKSMVFYIHLLRCPNDIKRNFMYGAMKVMGKYDSLHSQIISKNANPICEDSNMRLDKLASYALKSYPKLATNLIAYLNGQADLDKILYHTFDAQENWQDIKVLPIEEEKYYEI